MDGQGTQRTDILGKDRVSGRAGWGTKMVEEADRSTLGTLTTGPGPANWTVETRNPAPGNALPAQCQPSTTRHQSCWH